MREYRTEEHYCMLPDVHGAQYHEHVNLKQAKFFLKMVSRFPFTRFFPGNFIFLESIDVLSTKKWLKKSKDLLILMSKLCLLVKFVLSSFC